MRSIWIRELIWEVRPKLANIPGLEKGWGGGKKVRPGDEHIEEAAETRDYTLSLLSADIQNIWKSVHCASITIKGQPKQRATACHHLQSFYVLKWQE